jgi:VWFA-related protein
MSVKVRLASSFLASLLLGSAVLSQQNNSADQAPHGRIHLDVVVTGKSGPPVAGLKEQDFALLDNKAPQAIASFRAVAPAQEPVEIIMVIDAVNTSFQSVAYERTEIDKFLRADGGHLPRPTTIAIFTDQGMQLQEGFTQDGNALSASLEKEVIGLRTIRRSAGFYGAGDRFFMSLTALNQLADREATKPGRKLIVWVSPGWPLLSGPEVQLDGKQRQEFFENIVSMSTKLLQARITLYSVDPLGTSDFGTRAFYYQSFLKGVRGPNQTDIGDLALQVLAVHSGGLALTINNDVASMLRECVADTEAYYEISFDPPVETKRDEYHQLEIKVADSKLSARTSQGYYAQPEVKEIHKVPVLPTR